MSGPEDTRPHTMGPAINGELENIKNSPVNGTPGTPREEDYLGGFGPGENVSHFLCFCDIFYCFFYRFFFDCVFFCLTI